MESEVYAFKLEAAANQETRRIVPIRRSCSRVNGYGMIRNIRSLGRVR